ncbi:hypothetical protein QVD17_11576 [Tagetes erecta]|uniref:PWWP domain-containing protein n=1 Tax=Tagetes erecta TaxID=13708 RepID=A0AAD8KXJ9_TARER|nr:hypothetical protein QVD17_11576 [Tagetes erecta]
MSTNVAAIESTSDAVASSEPFSNNDIAVSSDVMDVVETTSLDTKTETLTTEPCCGDVVVQHVVGDARVSGAEIEVVMDKGEKNLDESTKSSSDAVVSSAASYGVKIGDIVAQDSIDDARVSRDGTGVVIENNEVVKDLVGDARVYGDEIGTVLSADAVASSAPLEIGADSLESKSDHDGEGDSRVSTDGKVIEIENSERVHDLVGDATVSGDKHLDVLSSDAVISSALPEIGADLLESKPEMLIVETSDHDGGGDTVAQDSIDDNELVLDKPVSDDAASSIPLNNRDIDVVNEIKTGTDSLGSETENVTMKTSADQNVGGDIAARGSNDDPRVSGDEKEIAMENIEKATDDNEDDNYEEKEGEYKVTDLVWAKVKNYPWWPGQIFDPSSASDKAKKHSNKKGSLVGYFGDQTFAWNKPSKIKPFRKHFHKLEKQSNSKPFFHAVNCALDEVSRRVDFGLACSCISKEVRDKIRSQAFVNSGIREEASKIDGSDRFSTVSTFKPVKVVQSLQELAREHFDGFNRLEVLSMRTQLLAFFRWKGYYQFQAQNMLDGQDNKLEDESELPLKKENKVVEDEKPAAAGKKVSSKMKPDVSDSDDSVPHTKERSLTNLTPKGNSSVKGSKKNISKEATPDDNVFKEGNGNDKPASVGKQVSSKRRKADVNSDSDDSAPRKKERSLTNMTPKGNLSGKRIKKTISEEATTDNSVFEEGNGNEKPASVTKKVSSKKRKPVDSDTDDSAPRKKEKSSTNVTSKGNSSVKRSKKDNSEKATPDDNVKEGSGNEKTASAGKKVSSKKRKPDVYDSDDSVPPKKEKSLVNMSPKGNSSVKRIKKGISKETTPDDIVSKEEKGNKKPASVGKKDTSKKRKPDICDSDDSVPHKKEKSLANMSPKGNSSVKRSKKGISKKAVVEDNVSKKENGNGTEDKKSSIASPKKLNQTMTRIRNLDG